MLVTMKCAARFVRAARKRAAAFLVEKMGRQDGYNLLDRGPAIPCQA